MDDSWLEMAFEDAVSGTADPDDGEEEQDEQPQTCGLCDREIWGDDIYCSRACAIRDRELP